MGHYNSNPVPPSKMPPNYLPPPPPSESPSKPVYSLPVKTKTGMPHGPIDLPAVDEEGEQQPYYDEVKTSTVASVQSAVPSQHQPSSQAIAGSRVPVSSGITLEDGVYEDIEMQLATARPTSTLTSTLSPAPEGAYEDMDSVQNTHIAAIRPIPPPLSTRDVRDALFRSLFAAGRVLFTDQ